MHICVAVIVNHYTDKYTIYISLNWVIQLQYVKWQKHTELDRTLQQLNTKKRLVYMYMYTMYIRIPVLKVGPQLMMSGWGGGAKGIPLLLVATGAPFKRSSPASLSTGGPRERGGSGR